ncbi:MAG: hypothetical protein WC761_01090 [Candidatus Paceibacterota bacterium]|jgi:hypothetical protein
MLSYKEIDLTEIAKIKAFDFAKLFEDIVVPEKLTALKLKKTYYGGYTDILATQSGAAISSGGMYLFVEKSARSTNYRYHDASLIVPLDSEDNYTNIPAEIVRYISLEPSQYAGDMGKMFLKWWSANFKSSYAAEYARTNEAYRTGMAQLWDFFQDKWNEARRARRATIREKMSNDPSFATEVKVTGDIEKTQASLAVLSELGKLRSVIDSIISGVGKNGVSEDTIDTYSRLMGSMGSDRRSIVSPLRKHFLKKNKKK